MVRIYFWVWKNKKNLDSNIFIVYHGFIRLKNFLRVKNMDKTQIPSEAEILKMSLMLKIVSDSTRVKILFAIKNKPKSVNDIVAVVGASQSAVSHQLKLMRGVNIVETKRDGNKIYYCLSDNKISKMLDIARSRI